MRVKAYDGYLNLNAVSTDQNGAWLPSMLYDEITIKVNPGSGLSGQVDLVLETHTRSSPTEPAMIRVKAGGGTMVSGDTITGGSSSATSTFGSYSTGYPYDIIVTSPSGRYTADETVTGNVSSAAAVVEEYFEAAEAVELERISIADETARVYKFPIDFGGKVRVSLDLGTSSTFTGDIDVILSASRKK